jgi:hypothetical protein
MKIHVALQNDSVKTLVGHGAAIPSPDAPQIRKEMPHEGALGGQTAYMTGNMHPTKKHLRPQSAASFVPGTVND